MSLRKALASLPDDRETAGAVREIVAYIAEHRDGSFDVARVSRATGLPRDVAGVVLSALTENFVLDCDGDCASGTFTFAPDTVVSLEVERFLRSKIEPTTHLHVGVDRYRSRFRGSN